MPLNARILPVVALFTATACSSFSPFAGQVEPAPQSRAATSVAALGVPPGHLPPAGSCRVWMPGTPPGRQPRSRSCANIERAAPAGSWILYRPAADREVVQVRVVDQRRPGVIVHLRTYNARSGAFVREG